jgi:hypothetical protein
MITALIILSIAIALRRAGLELPVVDKMINFVDNKLNKLRKNKDSLSKLDIKTLTIENEPLYNAKRHSNDDLYSKYSQVRNNTKMYSGDLKI